jgi:hypothetical protein
MNRALINPALRETAPETALSETAPPKTGLAKTWLPKTGRPANPALTCPGDDRLGFSG